MRVLLIRRFGILFLALALAGLTACASKTEPPASAAGGGAPESVRADDLAARVAGLENTCSQLKRTQEVNSAAIVRLTQAVRDLENRLQAASGKPTGVRSAAPPAESQAHASPEQQYNKARNLLLEGSPDQALDLFNTFLAANPDHKLAENAMYWAGECHYTTHRYKDAVQVFQALVQHYPRGVKVPDALLKTAYCYLSLNDDNRAHHYLKQVVTRYPFSTAAEKAQEKLNAFN